jgi:hypothetical protein
MERTIVQLKSDLKEIATQHKQINSFFWGDFVDAINKDAVDYPLMVCTLQPGSKSENTIKVNFTVIIADKYNEGDFRMIDEVHSDTYQIQNDIYITMKQNKFEEYLSIVSDTTDTPFINEGADLTAGWSSSFEVEIWNQECQNSIPYTSYNFEN